MNNRPKIPAALEREVKMESGHRCAITTCKQTPVDIHHIVPWETCQKHEFDNLRALCPNCHRKAHDGDIDRKSIKMYKHNLSIVNSRYGDYERRILQDFVDNSDDRFIDLPYDKNTDILLMFLIRDKLLLPLPDKRPIRMSARGRERMWYELTEEGQQFISKWKVAEDIE
ncbi:HNH endonuclease signature motif containing protein [Microcoleus sp. Pol10D4]|uniref:HNH endonuclease signature motif containing protein n=1 Tax=Microcoleus sp. Pol10D4 TaxID=3055387 RepID=UPI002FD18471